MSEVKYADRVITLQTGLIAIAVTILLAAIPFAYSIHGRLTAVEINSTVSAETVKMIAADVKVMATNEARINSLEARVNKLESRP